MYHITNRKQLDFCTQRIRLFSYTHSCMVAHSIVSHQVGVSITMYPEVQLEALCITLSQHSQASLAATADWTDALVRHGSDLNTAARSNHHHRGSSKINLAEEAVGTTCITFGVKAHPQEKRQHPDLTHHYPHYHKCFWDIFKVTF